jgi:hypothetical protein
MWFCPIKVVHIVRGWVRYILYIHWLDQETWDRKILSLALWMIRYLYFGQGVYIFPLKVSFFSKYGEFSPCGIFLCNGTSPSGYLCQEDTHLYIKDTNVQSQMGHLTSVIRTPSQLRTAVVSPKGVLNREVPLYLHYQSLEQHGIFLKALDPSNSYQMLEAGIEFQLCEGSSNCCYLRIWMNLYSVFSFENHY